ncbi:aminotransferase [Marinicauda salina]|uniref:Cysteine desulfurase n=1 Tax=Marinicauda salina TaxID=2135793 RepID=A0A2U2BTG8_9PROT|nr:cysteine desulfurase family protein [Marinicauda salina]PWE17297.1 aminotransferase [Marinicauda salina]
MKAYLDHNATAPARPEAIEAVAEAMAAVGNPNSVHAEGRAARARLEQARAVIAGALGAMSDELVLTSGGTEADNLALASAETAGATRLIVSSIEHEAVLDPARASDLPTEYMPVTADGVVDLDWLAERLSGWDVERDGPPFVALMAANNETGVIQPVADAARLVREVGGYLHVDAVQVLGKTSFDFASSGAHYAAVSAHKIGGPLGVGALLVKEGAPLSRRQHGGGQEKGRRSGTENVVGAVGFAAAIEAAMNDDLDAIGAMRDRAAALIRDGAPEVRIWGENAPRTPNTLSMSAPGWPGELQVIALDLAGFAISAGSACSSGKTRRSRVLESMGAREDEAGAAVRVSFGRTNTMEEAEGFAAAWLDAYAMARSQSAAV